tara:strand:+ start:1443 stop:1892 length:450 start_codon:yes stop_codon:yes gene_type:complete
MKHIIIITFILFSQNLISQEKFKLCGDTTTFPYYFINLQYSGGFWEVKSHFYKDYPEIKMQNMRNNTGIVCIQFSVNCKGESGKYSIKTYDLDNTSKYINEEISNYFLLKTKSLKNWIPPKDENRNPINCHKFFSFKILNGKLIEILPK